MVLISGSYCTLDWNSYMKTLNRNNKNNITIAYCNGGSSCLGKSVKGKEKLLEVENLLNKHNIDVLGLSEANLDTELEEYIYKIQGYHCIKSPGRVSRLVTYVREDLLIKDLKSFGQDMSCSWLEIGKGKNKYLVCNFYREFKLIGVDGSNSFEEQSNRLEQFLKLTKKARNCQNVVILGDFNVDLNEDIDEPNNSNSILKDMVLDTLPLEGFTQIVKKNTRHCNNSKLSLIDHIWNKNMSKLIQVKQLEAQSDHDLILAVLKTNGMVNSNSSVKNRDYRKFNYNDFFTELCGLNWTEVYNLEDPTLIAARITELFCIPLDSMAPIKLRNIKENKKKDRSLVILC